MTRRSHGGPGGGAGAAAAGVRPPAPLRTVTVTEEATTTPTGATSSSSTRPTPGPAMMTGDVTTAIGTTTPAEAAEGATGSGIVTIVTTSNSRDAITGTEEGGVGARGGGGAGRAVEGAAATKRECDRGKVFSLFSLDSASIFLYSLLRSSYIGRITRVETCACATVVLREPM